jgi:hypothetical protein
VRHPLLFRQVARSFGKLRAAAVPEAAEAIAEAAARKLHTLKAVPAEAFPLFLSSRQFLRMLDGKRCCCMALAVCSVAPALQTGPFPLLLLAEHASEPETLQHLQAVFEGAQIEMNKCGCECRHR